MKIIVGLGNIGQKYTLTRHNAGFMALDFFASKSEISTFHEEKKHSAQIVKVTIEHEVVLLAKPTTFMNHSGDAVQKIVSYFNVDPTTDLLIIYDDVDIPFGSIKTSGKSAAGHNGMKSIIEMLGTHDIHRLRIGIAPEQTRQSDTAHFVLDLFSKKELDELKTDIFPKATELITSFIVKR